MQDTGGTSHPKQRGLCEEWPPKAGLTVQCSKQEQDEYFICAGSTQSDVVTSQFKLDSLALFGCVVSFKLVTSLHKSEHVITKSNYDDLYTQILL